MAPAQIALSIPTDLGRPFATWSLARLADYLVRRGGGHRHLSGGLCQLPARISFQVVRTWKRSNDPNFEAKKNRILELYEAADIGTATVICLDEFGPLNLQPQPGGKVWASLKKPKRIRALNRTEAQFKALRYFTLRRPQGAKPNEYSRGGRGERVGTSK
jgi:hypothetical protein